MITKLTVIEIKKVKETARLLANAIFSLFCFDRNVIYKQNEPRKYRMQIIITEKGFNNYHSLEFLIFKAFLNFKIFSKNK
jgi:hypothetical protein